MHAALQTLQNAWRTLFARWPAVPLVAFFMAGIATAPGMQIHFGWILVAVLVCVSGAAITFRRANFCSVLLLVGIGLLGVLIARWHQFYFADNQIARFTTDQPKLSQLRLQLTSTPRLITRASQRWEPPLQTAFAKAQQIRTVTGWQPCSGAVSLVLNKPVYNLAAGQTIEVIGWLQQPRGASNPGEFDWAKFYRHQRILADVQVTHADAVTVISPPGFQPIEWLRQHARQWLDAGFTSRQRHGQALLTALVLGDRQPQMRDAQEDFTASGAAYLLAISGLHVLMVGAAAYILLGRILTAHPRWATIGAMTVVLIYALIVVPGTPAVRATVLFLAFGMSKLIQRRIEHLQLLALCAMGILIAEPHELSSAGFQLSFMTVAGLIIGARPMAKFLTSIFEDEHDRVARSFRQPGFWGSAALDIRRWVIGHMSMASVAWLVSMPLILIHFQQVNPWALLAGLIVLPLLAIVLIGGLLKMLLTLIVPAMALHWANISAAPLDFLRSTVHALAHLPAANLMAVHPSPLWVIAGYLLLILPLLPWRKRALQLCARCTPMMAVAVVCLPGLFGIGFPDGAGEACITLLSIGAGQIGIIELPQHHAVLIDDGSSTATDPLHHCLAPYLQLRGIRRIDAIFLSHPDYDHISAAAATAQMFHAAHVYINPVFRQQSENNPTARMTLRRLEADHIPIEEIHRGQQIPLSADATIDVLWPPDHRYFTTTNNAGLVLKLNYHGRSALFPADIQVPTEDELRKDHTSLHADVLVAPHHGSAENSTTAFIAAVHPSMILSSNSDRLSSKQKQFDHLTASLPVYRTSRYGALTLHLFATGQLEMETFLHPR